MPGSSWPSSQNRISLLGPSKRPLRDREALGEIALGDAALRLVHAEALIATGDRERAALDGARARLATHAEKIGDREMRRSILEDVPEHAALARAQADAGAMRLASGDWLMTA